jgi:GNAT superfamily N-acetyltransferase
MRLPMSSIQIFSYRPEFQSHFESINKAWVTRYFSLEPFDLEQLERPEEAILAKGGVILFAQFDNEIVGTVGLIPKDAQTCEMIKMGVLDRAQGQGIGRALGEAILEVAREMGFSKMVLYSNTKLTAALSVYQKLGFCEVKEDFGGYGRCDIKMELKL